MKLGRATREYVANKQATGMVFGVEAYAESSEGEQNRFGRPSIIPPSERHFHSEAPVYRPFWRECVRLGAGGAEIGAFQKPA